jgi:hypothetical protein
VQGGSPWDDGEICIYFAECQETEKTEKQFISSRSDPSTRPKKYLNFAKRSSRLEAWAVAVEGKPSRIHLNECHALSPIPPPPPYIFFLRSFRNPVAVRRQFVLQKLPSSKESSTSS